MTTSCNGNKLILFLGSKWWGSDCKSLSSAFRSKGHALIEVDPEDYFPIRWSNFMLKVIRKLTKPIILQDYNRAVLRYVDNSSIDFVLASKGNLLKASTIRAFRGRGIPVYCFYPDVSFRDQEKEIRQSIAAYNCIFTTKSFHLKDQRLVSMLNDIRLVRHGYDPAVHRILELDSVSRRRYVCDISFVGAWSSKKEKVLTQIITKFPDLDIKIWGPGWERSGAVTAAHWQGRAIRGDELVIQYSSAKINLGILSDAKSDTSSGDQVTTRTWHIPACGGFLLHEKSDELSNYFKLGTEVTTYESVEDLVQKIQLYIDKDDLRMSIARAGHKRCMESGYNYELTVRKILDYHSKKSRTKYC